MGMTTTQGKMKSAKVKVKHVNNASLWQHVENLNLKLYSPHNLQDAQPPL